MLKTFIWIHFLLIPAEFLFSVVGNISGTATMCRSTLSTLYFLLPAQVAVYAQNSKDGEKLLLTCIARDQGVTDVQIKRNGETVTKEEGLMRSDTETNEDGPSEIRAHVEISKDKTSEYSYEVIYEAPKNPTVNKFDCALAWREPSEQRPALMNPQSWYEIGELLVCYTHPRPF